jgi:hypothetical protein
MSYLFLLQNLGLRVNLMEAQVIHAKCQPITLASVQRASEKGGLGLYVEVDFTFYHYLKKA